MSNPTRMCMWVCSDQCKRNWVNPFNFTNNDIGKSGQLYWSILINRIFDCHEILQVSDYVLSIHLFIRLIGYNIWPACSTLVSVHPAQKYPPLVVFDSASIDHHPVHKQASKQCNQSYHPLHPPNNIQSTVSIPIKQSFFIHPPDRLTDCCRWVL